MQRQTESSTDHPTVRDHQDHDLHRRIRAEFVEMPGLKLTLPQASRLFNLELTRCERVLGALVDIGSLATEAGAFVRPGAGRRYV
jgi:hypothetical protein